MTNDPLERSDRSLRAARLLLDQGFYEEVFPLAFHAGENAVRGVLSTMGLSSKTHASTLREFGRLLIERGLDQRLEQLRRRQMDQAASSVEFLQEMLAVARDVTAAERAEEEGRLDEVSLLPDPNIGALTRIFREYAPADTPVIIEEVVASIDEIVRQARFTGWTQSQPGDREVRKQLRLALTRFGLPPTGDLFDRAYAYIRENY